MKNKHGVIWNATSLGLLMVSHQENAIRGSWRKNAFMCSWTATYNNTSTRIIIGTCAHRHMWWFAWSRIINYAAARAKPTPEFRYGISYGTEFRDISYLLELTHWNLVFLAGLSSHYNLGLPFYVFKMLAFQTFQKSTWHSLFTMNCITRKWRRKEIMWHRVWASKQTPRKTGLGLGINTSGLGPRNKYLEALGLGPRASE